MSRVKRWAPWACAGIVTVLSGAMIVAALQPVPAWLYVTDPAAAAGQEAVLVETRAVEALGDGDVDAAKQYFKEASSLFLESGDKDLASDAQQQIDALEDVPEVVEPVATDLAESS